jgi:hypothetical protein
VKCVRVALFCCCAMGATSIPLQCLRNGNSIITDLIHCNSFLVTKDLTNVRIHTLRITSDVTENASNLLVCHVFLCIWSVLMY